MTDRPLPHNRQLERAVLGGLLTLRDPDFAMELFSAASTGLWHTSVHTNLAEILEEMARGSDMSRQTFVARVLSADGGWYEAALEVMKAVQVPTKHEVRSWVGQLNELAQRRAIIIAAGAAVEAAYSPQEPVREVTNQLAAAAADAGDRFSPTAVPSILEQTAQYAGWRGRTRVSEGAIKHGLPELDAHGILAPEYVAVLARSSVGKTAMTLTMAAAQMLQGFKVAIASMEQGQEELLTKILSIITGLSFRTVAGYVQPTPDEERRIEEALVALPSLPLSIRYGIAPVEAICGWAGALRRDGNVDILYIDQFDKFSLDTRQRATKEQAMAAVSQALFAFQRRTEMPVVLVHQLGLGEYRHSYEPTRFQCRDCRQLVQDVDRCYVLDRPETEPERMRDIVKQRGNPPKKGGKEWAEIMRVEGKIAIKLEKDRNGTGGGPYREWCRWNPHCGRIETLR